jgi:3',5'-nucleoside bisphosphate phosphatase
MIDPVKIDFEKYSSGLLDFHNHSTHSDGGDTPAELVRRAKANGVSAMALTDHHVATGLEEFLSVCKENDILGMPFGTEIHAELPTSVLEAGDNDAPDLIILGRNAKPERLNDYLAILQKDRRDRFIPDSLEKLRKNLGFYIPHVDFEEEAKDLGNPRILHKIVYEKDNMVKLYEFAKSKNPAVKLEEVQKQPIKFMNRYAYPIGGEAYSKRLVGFTVTDAVQLAKDANCLLVIAHPGGEFGFLSDKVLDYMIQTGVRGIEIRSYFNTEQQNAKFDMLAKKHELVRSGGSDCHGEKGPFKIGISDRPYNQVPKDVLKELWNSLP